LSYGLFNTGDRQGIIPLLVGEESSKMKRIGMSGELAQDSVVTCFGLLETSGLMMPNRFLEQAMGFRGQTLSA
jgi:hypothetical protein